MSRGRAIAFSAFGLGRVVIVFKVFYLASLPLPNPSAKQKRLWWDTFLFDSCLYSEAFPGCCLVQLQVWDM